MGRCGCASCGIPRVIWRGKSGHDCLTLLSGGWMNHCPSSKGLSTQDGPTACHIIPHLSDTGSGEDCYWASKKRPYSSVWRGNSAVLLVTCDLFFYVTVI